MIEIPLSRETYLIEQNRKKTDFLGGAGCGRGRNGELHLVKINDTDSIQEWSVDSWPLTE